MENKDKQYKIAKLTNKEEQLIKNLEKELDVTLIAYKSGKR